MQLLRTREELRTARRALPPDADVAAVLTMGARRQVTRTAVKALRGEVEALHMRFRMAVHFPDLPMMGAHGFTKLMSSPGATEDALESVAGQP